MRNFRREAPIVAYRICANQRRAAVRYHFFSTDFLTLLVSARWEIWADRVNACRFSAVYLTPRRAATITPVEIVASPHPVTFPLPLAYPRFPNAPKCERNSLRISKFPRLSAPCVGKISVESASAFPIAQSSLWFRQFALGQVARATYFVFKYKTPP